MLVKGELRSCVAVSRHWELGPKFGVTLGDRRAVGSLERRFAGMGSAARAEYWLRRVPSSGFPFQVAEGVERRDAEAN